MIPLKDNIPSRTTPMVNYLIIVACSLIFLAQWSNSRDGDDTLAERFGMIPARITRPNQPVEIPDVVAVRTPRGIEYEVTRRPAAESPIPAWLTLISSMFLHGGWLHLIGNMWFLFVFGDNVEDRFGHVGYLLFYVASGIAAGVLQFISGPLSPVPTIGASGAIAGVMGAYFMLYPRARVLTLIPLFIFFYTLWIPAPIFLGFWFVFQFFQGAVARSTSEVAQGVAWWAHVGGFAAGLLLAWQARRAGWLAPEEPELPVGPRVGLPPRDGPWA